MPLDYKREYFRYRQYYLQRAQTLYEQPVTRASISLILSLLTISFFGFFAIKPTFTTVAKLIKEVKNQKVVDESLSKKINDLTKAQATYLTVKPNVELVEKVLPKDPQLVRFTQELNFLSFKHTLLITAFNFNEFNLFGGSPIKPTKEQERKVTEEETISKEKVAPSKSEVTPTTPNVIKSEKTEPVPIVFNLTIVGQYQNMRDFLNDFENLDRLIEIDSVSFSTKSEMSDALKLEISGKALYF